MDPNDTLPPDYSPEEYAPLAVLEQGNIDIWVRRRGVFLIEKARETASECEAGKLGSLLVVAAASVLSANPLMWLPLCIGAGGYIYTVFQEFQDLGSIKPIPLYRGKLSNLLKALEGQQSQERHPLLDQIEYLTEAEKDEILLLNYRFGEIAGLLASVPPGVRFDLYRHLCCQFHARRELIGEEEVRNYVSTAVSEVRRQAPIVDTTTRTHRTSISPDLLLSELPGQSQERVATGAEVMDAPMDTTPINTLPRWSYTDLNQCPQTNQDYSDVVGLVDEGSVMFLGTKGSGKTSKLSWLLGEHVKRGHLVQMVNPFAPASQFKGIKVWGRGLDYRDATGGICQFTKEAKNRIKLRGTDPNFDPFNQLHWHLALDELSNYGTKIDAVDENAMPEFWEICTQFLRQVNMSVSFAGHGDTQVMMGGEKALRGKSKTLKRDIIFIHCQRVTDTSIQGNYRCAGWAEMVWMEGDSEQRKRIDIPEWMQGPSGNNFVEFLKTAEGDNSQNISDFRSTIKQQFKELCQDLDLKISERTTCELSWKVCFPKLSSTGKWRRRI